MSNLVKPDVSSIYYEVTYTQLGKKHSRRLRDYSCLISAIDVLLSLDIHDYQVSCIVTYKNDDYEVKPFAF